MQVERNKAINDNNKKYINGSKPILIKK